MELLSSDASSIYIGNSSVEFKQVVASHQTLIDGIKWTQQLDIKHGSDELEKMFYPFKRVKYYSYLEAFREAKKLNKLVHFIMLWGALDVSKITSVYNNSPATEVYLQG